MIRLAHPKFPDSVIDDLTAILESGHLVQGHRVAAFEARLAQYLGTRHAIAVSSGTAALHVALLASGIGPGDEVVVPAFTFPATANVVEMAGARTTLVDVGPDDLCIDPSALETAITQRTRAIIAVHAFGQPAPMDAVLGVATKHGITLIEDAACALGAQYDGKNVGTFGLIGCFSFHPRKSLTTGEGGLVVTDDEAVAERSRALRNHGIQSVQGRAEFVRPGLNYRMTEIQAALGLGQVAAFENEGECRRRLASIYDTHLASSPLTLPKHFPQRLNAFQTYHVILPDQIDRAVLIEALKREGIETNLGAQALNCLSFFQKHYDASPETHPNATRAYRKGLALPIGSHVSEADVQYVSRALLKHLGG